MIGDPGDVAGEPLSMWDQMRRGREPCVYPCYALPHGWVAAAGRADSNRSLQRVMLGNFFSHPLSAYALKCRKDRVLSCHDARHLPTELLTDDGATRLAIDGAARTRCDGFDLHQLPVLIALTSPTLKRAFFSQSVLFRGAPPRECPRPPQVLCWRNRE